MEWKVDYRRKTVTAAEAVSVVKSGDTIAVPLGQKPEAIMTALAVRKNELKDVRLLVGAPNDMEGIEWFDPQFHEAFDVVLEIFTTVVSRPATDAHIVDYSPILSSLQHKLFDERREEARDIDVCVVVATPPDKNGYCNFGGALWTKNSYSRRAKKVLAEVSPNLIRVNGDGFIHVSQVDYFVETNAPTPIRAQPEIQDYHRRIAGYISTLVRDGDTIQVGTGGTTSALVKLGAFDKANDLGAHTELTVPGYTGLVRRGIITGKYKTISPYKHVAAAWSGDAEDMAFMDGNPTFEARDAKYVLSIKTISAHDNMLAINNALCIDLTGSICSESIGTRMFSGAGGQPEFQIGAVVSEGGRGVIVLPSTAIDGTVSRIVPFIKDGSYVTVPRTFADIVVTEYGIARLLGRTHRERAEALIDVAHPDFREELRAAARKLFWP